MEKEEESYFADRVSQNSKVKIQKRSKAIHVMEGIKIKSQNRYAILTFDFLILT
jgi:hypothetical protein